MSKRPLCVLAAGFLLIQVFRLWQMEPEPEQALLRQLGEEGSTILCSGTVQRWEERGDGTLCYELISVSKDLTDLKDSMESIDSEDLVDSPASISDVANLDVILNDSNSNDFISKASDQKQISNKQLGLNWKLLVYDKESREHFPVGSRVQIQGTLRYFDRAVNPGMFDSRAFYRRKGIAAMFFAEKIEKVPERMQTSELSETLCRFRTAWKKMLYRGMDEKHAATVAAILLGEKSGMDPDVKEEFQLGGIGHILAISSLHMSLLGIGLYQFLRKRGLPFWSAGLVGSSFLGLYVLMVGIGVSTTRALVMYLVKIGAEITGRTYDGWTALFLAAAIVTGIQPLYFTDSGFWLSFGAISGILLWQEIGKNLLENRANGITMWAGFTGVAVQIFLLPIQLFYQYEVSGYSILLNAVVIPLMSVLLGSALLGSLFLAGGSLPVTGKMVWGAGSGILKGTEVLLECYRRLCQITLKMPGARIVTGKPQIWKMAGYYLLVFLGVWIAIKRKGRRKQRRKREKRRGKTKPHRVPGKEKKSDGGRKKKIAGMTLAIMLAFLLLLLPESKKKGLEMVMLDVGQGDGIAIHFPDGKNLLVDGGSLDVEDLAKYRLEPYLKSRGISRLDYVFVTHGDQDHISGIVQMMEREDRGVKIETLVVPIREVWEGQLEELVSLAKTKKIRVVEMKEEQILAFSGGTIRCLQPGEMEYPEPGNAASMVLLLSYGKFDLLLTGDVEEEGERMLTEKLASEKEKGVKQKEGQSEKEERSGIGEIEVLKVAHHGSKNSTSEEFLSVVQPECALLSAGKKNRYGHPHEETMNRLAEEGVMKFCTIEMGAIRIRTDGEKYQICGLCGQKETDIIGIKYTGHR